MRKGLTLLLAILLAGVDVRAQDITDLPDTSLEGVGVTCIALVVFEHARHESYLGQALVAHAIVNRTAALPDGADPCDVVLAPGAFPRLEALPFPREPGRVDSVAWARAIEVAQVVLSGDYAIPRPMARITAFARGRDVMAPATSGLLADVGTVGALSFFRPVDSDLIATTGRAR